MARYAALCQEADIVPIVEPEILMDGDHPIERARTATAGRSRRCTNSSPPIGSIWRARSSRSTWCSRGGCRDAGRARRGGRGDTSAFFARHVPADVAGVVFLSGGQSDVDATIHLNEMNRSGPHPWPLSFSYGRALQAPSLSGVGRRPARTSRPAQRALAHRARMNGLAQTGDYSADAESSAA